MKSEGGGGVDFPCEVSCVWGIVGVQGGSVVFVGMCFGEKVVLFLSRLSFTGFRGVSASCSCEIQNLPEGFCDGICLGVGSCMGTGGVSGVSLTLGE